METKITEQLIGGYGKVNSDLVPTISDVVAEVAKQHALVNGQTALFWHLISTINMHISDESL